MEKDPNLQILWSEKMKTENLILLGAIALGAYFLWKSGLFGGEGFGSGGGGGGIDLGGNGGGTDYSEIHAAAGSRQSWTNVTYGQPGQPSVKFLENTLREARSPGASAATKQAAIAAYAGAPPRMVAKIKAGQHILDGGKY
jgi:hypothetical protein